jgi:RNA-splicing ligase RtcB
MWQTREVFSESCQSLNTGLFYGVTHNIAKLEEHRLDTVESK